MHEIEILSVNISQEKGTVKHPLKEIQLTRRGVEGDAHSGNWHRQVSLLAGESIDQASDKAHTRFPWGAFAENITTLGMALHHTRVFDRFINKEVELEVTQIGKKCHSKCAIGKQVGDCIMPIEGIFARVVKEGRLAPGDRLVYVPKTFRIKIITLSDRASAGEYEDRSGPAILEASKNWFDGESLPVTYDTVLIPDEKEALKKAIVPAAEEGFDVVFTTGSTGIGERDIAPETLLPLLDKEIPGIMERIRMKYGVEKPNALLSRSIAGVKGRTLLFTLPGSPKAAAEYMEEIHKILYHAVLMVHGIGAH